MSVKQKIPIRGEMKIMATGHEQLIIGKVSSPHSIAKQTGPDESYVRRILGLSFLAPDIVESFLNGRQPEEPTLEKLRMKLPMRWAERLLRNPNKLPPSSPLWES
jgi:hypothetical protein